MGTPVPSDVLLPRALAGDFAAMARLMSRAEAGVPESRPALAQLYARAGHAHIIGITGVPAPPKLQIDKFADGGIVCLRLSGTIDEAFEGKKLAETIKAQTLVLDLGDIRKVSSFGIREWVDFINGVGKHSERIVLVECAPKIVDQFNMVANFSWPARYEKNVIGSSLKYCISPHCVHGRCGGFIDLMTSKSRSI